MLGSNLFGASQVGATSPTGASVFGGGFAADNKAAGGLIFGATSPVANASLQGGAVPRPFVFNPASTVTTATPAVPVAPGASTNPSLFSFTAPSSLGMAQPAFGATPSTFSFSMTTPTPSAAPTATPVAAVAPGTVLPGSTTGISTASAPPAAAVTGLSFTSQIPNQAAPAGKPSFVFTTAGSGATTTPGATAGVTPGLTLPTSSSTSAGFTLGSMATPATTGSLLGAYPTPTATTTSAITPSTLTAPTPLVAAPSAATAVVAPTAAVAVPCGTVAIPGAAGVSSDVQMNFRQLEEQINKWMLELEEQEKAFLQQAMQVNAWDRILLDNGEKIHQLNHDLDRVKIDQQRLDNELDFIHSQQKELEDLLTPLEASVEQLPPLSYQHHADIEREHTYQLAESIDGQLNRMVLDLKEIIGHLNTTNSSEENTDPVHQITKILNVHMDSLRWIDQNAGLLNRRVEDISTQMELQRKEQERNYRLVFN